MKNKRKSIMTAQNSITLQQLLEHQFGKENVKVVKWKWTQKQLKKLENEPTL